MLVIVTYNISDTELSTLSKEDIEILIQYGRLTTAVHGLEETSPFWDEEKGCADNPVLINPEIVEVVEW